MQWKWGKKRGGEAGKCEDSILEWKFECQHSFSGSDAHSECDLYHHIQPSWWLQPKHWLTVFDFFQSFSFLYDSELWCVFICTFIRYAAHCDPDTVVLWLCQVAERQLHIFYFLRPLTNKFRIHKGLHFDYNTLIW